MDQAILNSAGLILLTAVLTFVMAAFWNQRSKKDAEARAKATALAEAEAHMRGRISDLEKQLIALTSVVTPLSAAMQAVFIKELTHFHTPELDDLLTKVQDGTLEDAEESRLLTLLEERSRDLDGRIPDSERDVATMFPMMMKRVKAERRLAAVDIQVVSMTATRETDP